MGGGGPHGHDFYLLTTKQKYQFLIGSNEKLPTHGKLTFSSNSFLYSYESQRPSCYTKT